MKNQHRNFDLDGPTPDLKERGPVFTLAGEDFRCLPVVPGGMIGDIMTTVVQGPDGDVMRDVPKCILCIKRLLVSRLWVEHDVKAEGEEAKGDWQPVDDVRRFDALLASKETLIETKKLAEIFDWLLMAYAERSNRPTSPSSL